jgi:hypothetical protein
VEYLGGVYLDLNDPGLIEGILISGGTGVEVSGEAISIPLGAEPELEELGSLDDGGIVQLELGDGFEVLVGADTVGGGHSESPCGSGSSLKVLPLPLRVYYSEDSHLVKRVA